MYFEQLLRNCGRCGGGFAVEYRVATDRLLDHSLDRVQVRCVTCPRCHHPNPVVMRMYTVGLGVWAVPTSPPVRCPPSRRPAWQLIPARPGRAEGRPRRPILWPGARPIELWWLWPAALLAWLSFCS